MTRRLLFSLSLSATVSLATAGSATLSFAADAKSDAAQRYKDGYDRFRAHDYEGSRAAFLQAYALDPQPRYLWNLAISEVKGNHPAEGLMHFKQYLATPGATEPASERAKVQKLMTDAASKTGHVVVTTAPGAVISVDGLPATLYADATLEVMPGAHLLEARLGTKTANVSVEPRAGETVRADLPIDAEATPPPAPVTTPAPVPAATQSPAPAASTMDVPPSGNDEGNRFWTPLRTSGVIVAGVGIASLIAGGVFVGQTEQDSSHVSSLSGTLGASGCSGASAAGCSGLQSARDDQSRDYALSLVFLGVGAVATAAGAAMFFWPTHDGHHAATLVPVISPVGGGLQLRGEL